MGGNLFEWNEQDISGSRGLRGGSWLNSSFILQSPPPATTKNHSRVAGTKPGVTCSAAVDPSI